MARGFELAVCAALAACGGETTRDEQRADDDGQARVCVEDARGPAGCEVSWRISDPCALFPSAAWLEAALYIAGCPTNGQLASGSPPGDLLNQVAPTGVAFSPYRGLEKKTYGFGVMLRDVSCTVLAYGCVDADLAAVSVIRTELRNWGADDTCSAATNGSCDADETCTGGQCAR